MHAFLLELNLNTPGFKYAMIVCAAPLWLPFVKALWKELNEMLAEEGGLLGRDPSPEELAEIRRRKAERGPTMVSEPHERGPAVQRLGGQARRSGATRPRASARRPTAGRRGFGPPRA